MLSNIAAGVLLVSLRPFRAEEIVQIGTVTGTVEKVHLFSTTLLTADSKEVVIPNGKIIADNIVNYSRHPFRRTDQVDCRLKYADRGVFPLQGRINVD